MSEAPSRADAKLIRDMGAAVSNWRRWGADDQLGTLNTISSNKVIEAARLVRKGEIFSLAVPFDDRGPLARGRRRFNPIHTMLATGTDAVAEGTVDAYSDDMVIMPLQCGTQWDALSHCFHEGVMYGGRSAALVTSRGAAKNGIEKVAGRVATRGVILDFARYRRVTSLAPGTVLEVDDLEAVIGAQGVSVDPGDALLLRTGFLQHCRERGDWTLYTEGASPGLSVRTVEWLRARDVAIVASDTYHVEVKPFEPRFRGPFHLVALVYLGLLVGELFELDPLAEACAADGTYDFLFVAPPLPFTGAVGSPVNPYAIR